MSKRFVAGVAACILACQAVAAVPDLTSSLTFVCDVTRERWGSSSSWNHSRSVLDLQAYQGRIYPGMGNWEKNSGPIYAMAIDPERRCCSNEYTMGTESCETIRVLADGNLHFPATDMKDGHAAAGYWFRRSPEGAWYTRTSSFVNSTISTHVWDFTYFLGRYFAAGYGIASSKDGNKWTDVNPAWSAGQKTERFVGFLVCGDELFARSERNIPFDSSGAVTTSSKYPAIYHHWNKTTEMFDTITNSYAVMNPGLKRSDYALGYPSSTVSTMTCADGHIWHATPFKDRCLYVLGSGKGISMFGPKMEILTYPPMGTYPAAAYSAYAENGELKGTRIALETGAYPYDITLVDETAYILTIKYKAASQNVEHAVWKSTDGLNFTKIFTVDFQQVMMSLEYLNGYFYFGVAYLDAQYYLGTLKSGITDRAGCVYRVWCPQEDEPEPPEQDAVTDVYPMYFEDASGYVPAITGDTVKASFTTFMFTTNDLSGTIDGAGTWKESALCPHAGAKYYCTKTMCTPNPSPAFATDTVVSFAGDVLVLGSGGQLYSLSGAGTRAFPRIENLYMLGGSRLSWGSQRNPLSGTAHIRRTTASLPARMQSNATFSKPQSVNLDFEGEANQWFTVMSDSTNTVKTIAPVFVMEGSWSNYYGAVTISNRTIVSGMTTTLRYQKGFVPAAFYVQTNGILQVTGEAVFSPRRLESWTSYPYEVEAGKTWTVGDLVLHEPMTFALKDATASVVVTNGFSNVSGSPLVVQLNQSTLAARACDYDLLTLPPGSATGASAVRVDLTGAAPKGFACTTSVVTDPETGRLAFRLAVRRGCKIFIR